MVQLYSSVFMKINHSCTRNGGKNVDSGLQKEGAFGNFSSPNTLFSHIVLCSMTVKMHPSVSRTLLSVSEQHCYKAFVSGWERAGKKKWDGPVNYCFLGILLT